MKINEKHLISFSIGSAAADKQGFLNKRGELNRSFQRRWFILKGNLLYYFDKKTDTEPIGVIVVEGCSIELSENAENFSFELNFVGAGSRTYVLAAESQEDMEDWMRALTCATYDYIRNAVSDLQRQLDELNSAGRPQDVSSVSTSDPATGELVAFKGLPRLNPFNVNADELTDVFPAASFDVQNNTGIRRPRTFEEMHYDFGDRILCALNSAD